MVDFGPGLGDAHAIMVLNHELLRHRGTLLARRRTVIVPDQALEDLGGKQYQAYVHANEEVRERSDQIREFGKAL